MPKGYWVAKANINNDKKLESYALLAEKVVKKYNGSFIVRGGEQITTEGECFSRNVVVEFPSYEIAIQAYHSKEYQEALEVLGDGADRKYAIVKGC